MLINKRMVKRHIFGIFCVALLAILLFLRYRPQDREIFEISSENEAKSQENTSRKTSRKTSSANTRKVAKKVERASEIHIDWGKNLKNPLDAEKTCGLHLESDIFSQTHDGYETMQISPAEIYSEKFTYVTSQVTPVISDPVIRLHPDKFMFPILMRGPNNQLLGLRESVYVAIRLNRTIVIPGFIRHRTDSQLKGGKSIHPVHRVDFDTVCRFVSCVTMQQFRTACGNQVDVILRLRHYSSKRVNEMESNTGLRFASNLDEKHKALNLVPKPKDKKSKTEIYFGPSQSEIRKLFDTDERCAVYALPFINLKIKVKSSKKKFHSQADLSRLSNPEIYSEIIRHTPPPKYMLEIADAFIKTIMGGANFLTVHWRYDKKDWMKRCKTLGDENDRKKRCDEAVDTKPIDVAKAILQKIKDLKPDVSDITHIYIASPPSENEFVKEMKKILNSENFAVSHLEDLIKFMREKFHSCTFLWDRADDIDSTIEMQICAKGLVFLRSSRSSWSGNVIEWRRHNKIFGTEPDKDEDIFLLTRKAKENSVKDIPKNDAE